MADNNEMQMEYKMFSDIWKLFKVFYKTSDGEEYWNDLLRDAHEIEDRYGNDLCKDILLAIIIELERKQIKEREERSC